MKSLKYLTWMCAVLGLLTFSLSSEASTCINIYNKVRVKGCSVLKKLPYAKKVCNLVNQGSKKICVWCGKHPSVCLAIAGAILYMPEDGLLLSNQYNHPLYQIDRT